MAFQDLFKFQDYKSMLRLSLQIPKTKEPTKALHPFKTTCYTQPCTQLTPHPTSRGRRQAATHGLGVAQHPPPDIPP